jgi:hypothetical protein
MNLAWHAEQSQQALAQFKAERPVAPAPDLTREHWTPAGGRALALFGLADLSATAEGRAQLESLGFDTQAQAELITGHEAEYELAQLQAAAASLTDTERLARYARVQLGTIASNARTADEAAKVALALRRLPAWVLESAAERAERRELERESRLARSTPRPSRQPGALAREQARQRRMAAELDESGESGREGALL